MAVMAVAWADVSNCACDAARPESYRGRECSLCGEADKRAGQEVFFLKDINPRKPNRWLALPGKHSAGGHPLHLMAAAEQARLWSAAIARSKELWGDRWGVAYNSEKFRTQCHAHIHIGKLLEGLAPGKFYDVDRPDQVRVPLDGSGVWVHGVGSRIRVHYGEGITETALLR
jgi:hypothetical protein